MDNQGQPRGNNFPGAANSNQQKQHQHQHQYRPSATLETLRIQNHAEIDKMMLAHIAQHIAKHEEAGDKVIQEASSYQDSGYHPYPESFEQVFGNIRYQEEDHKTPTMILRDKKVTNGNSENMDFVRGVLDIVSEGSDKSDASGKSSEDLV